IVAAAAAEPALAPAAVPAADTALAARPPPAAARRGAVGFALGLAAFALASVAIATWHRTHAPAAAPRSGAVTSGLVAVLPAHVHSALAQDGWMRLGLMALGADALRALPQHAVVPSESVIAALGTAGDDDAAAAARVRAATGAATIVHIDGRRERDRWQLEATLDGADGRRQTIGVDAGDAVAAGAALGERLRLAIGAEPAAAAEAADAPETLALAARIQADLLDGRAARALAQADDAGAPLAAAPRIVLLRAKAMNRLGRADEATAAVRALIARATAGAPWLAEAWTTLGYSELVDGRREDAERDFRNALAALGNDRVEAGRAWRGLGNAQAAREDFDAAEASFLRARMELEGSGDRLLQAHLLDDLGSVAARRGRFDEAIARYGEAATAAAAIGGGEIELGARMNIALAQQERLQHEAALDSWRALLPRVRALDYPAMRRFAAIHYADALAEAGALSEAAAALDDAGSADELGARDALEDARLDALRVKLALGDAHAVAASARTLAGAPGA
ncbi:MAG TPA: hypothetical protein VGC30_00350, partial [Dokdonella sp.]